LPVLDAGRPETAVVMDERMARAKSEFSAVSIVPRSFEPATAAPHTLPTDT